MKKLFLAGFAAVMMVATMNAKDISIKVPGGASYNINVDHKSLDQVRVALERISGKTLRLLQGSGGSYKEVSDYSVPYTDQDLVAKSDRARAEAGHHRMTQKDIDARAAAARAATRVAVAMPDDSGVLEFDFDEKTTVGDLRALAWKAYDAARAGDVDFSSFGIWIPMVHGGLGRMEDSERVQELNTAVGFVAKVTAMDYDEEVEAARSVAASDAEMKARFKMTAAQREAADKMRAARERAAGRSGKLTIDQILAAKKTAEKATAAAAPAKESELQRRLRLARERAEGGKFA